MAESGGFYKANAIFRDQPNRSYFDKPFEDPEDCLFLALNEIHPHFLQPEQLADKRGFEIGALKDPRTQKPITQYCFDHTKEVKTKTFRCLKLSKIPGQQHVLGVRVMKALQDENEVEEENLYKWRRMETARVKERQEFQKFVYEFNQDNKELMYKPTKKLLELYIKWYKEQSKILMLKYHKESYNTHLGLPQVRLCKDVLKEQVVSIINQEVVAKKGHQWIWNAKKGHQWIWNEQESMDFKNLQYSIEVYTKGYMNSQDLKDNYEEQLKTEFFKSSENECTNLPLWYIPLDSLLFLLTAGDYPDLPTEVLLDIKEQELTEGDSKKTIIMNSPLPSRQVGWHTYKQIVDQAALAFLSQTNKQKWVNYNVTDDEAVPEKEIQANLGSCEDFKVSSIEDYMEKCKITPDKNCKFTKTLIKWQLQSSASDCMDMQIYTSLSQPALNNTKDSLESSETLGSVSFKLEYKPQFGCEIMTKYEMLEEWFKLKLLQASKNICFRLDVNNYQTLLQETLTIQKLEYNLSNIYHIDVANLLTNLFEFLKILHNMPAGHYLLRYNSKFKDKLMLCKPSQEKTQNTLQLHQLLLTEPTDLLFMSQQNFLPISENLCSLMHLQHNILPCAFAPCWSPEQREKREKFMQRQPTKKFNDRDYIVKKLEMKKEKKEEQVQQKFKKSRTFRKRAQKAKRRERLNAAKSAKSEEQKEQDALQKEIEMDMILGT